MSVNVVKTKIVGDVKEITEYKFSKFEDFIQWDEYFNHTPQVSNKSVFDEDYTHSKTSAKLKRGLQEGEYLRFSKDDIAKVKDEFELHFTEDVWDAIEEESKHCPYIYVGHSLYPSEDQPYAWCSHEDYLYSHSVKMITV